MKIRNARMKEEPLSPSAGLESAQAGLDNGEVQQRIAVRAYELHRERSCRVGHELDDWLEAERDILPSMRRD